MTLHQMLLADRALVWALLVLSGLVPGVFVVWWSRGGGELPEASARD